MTIKLIVAADQGGAIGWSDGRLPWKLPADLKRFHDLTTWHTVVMGFNTWKSLNRPEGLPHRRNIVLTRKPYSEVRSTFSVTANVDIISSFNYLEQEVKRFRGDTFWIIGGTSVYEEALERRLVDEIHLTLVHADSGADVRLTTDLVAWKRFVVTQRAEGVDWETGPISRQWDGDIETSYLHFKKT
jgi:dihydrofolate reductase